MESNHDLFILDDDYRYRNLFPPRNTAFSFPACEFTTSSNSLAQCPAPLRQLACVGRVTLLRISVICISCVCETLLVLRFASHRVVGNAINTLATHVASDNI